MVGCNGGLWFSEWSQLIKGMRVARVGHASGGFMSYLFPSFSRFVSFN